MRRLLILLAFMCLAAPVQARVYNQAELDALAAPIALYPDSLLSQILMAATYPDEVAEAARWSRANPQLKGEEAVRAAQNEPWDPSVKSLLAFPEVLVRMAESPQWTRELGEAFLNQEPHVMDTVQGLRKRAQTSGHLQNEQNSVRQEGQDIVIQPAQPNVVYVPYYDPYVVYGPWWWHSYRPVYWSPWYAPPVFVSSVFFAGFNWPHRHVHVVRRPIFVKATQVHVVPGRWQHRPTQTVAGVVRQVQRVPESARQPIVSSMPAASRFSNDQPRRDVQRVEPRREAPRGESRRQPISRSAPQLSGAPSAAVSGIVGREVQRVEPRSIAPSVLPAQRAERQEQRSAGREVQRVEPRRSASAAVREHRGR